MILTTLYLTGAKNTNTIHTKDDVYAPGIQDDEV
jgi:hypothetical protein